MSEHTESPVSPTPVAPHEARLTERAPRLTLAGGTESSRTEAEFDALAELFLGDEPETKARMGSATAGPAAQSVGRANAAKDTPPIEGLILGHLPVSASSWVKTYAAMRARALGGPVGLIRLMGGSLAIELVGVDSRGDMGARTVEQALEALRRRAVGVVARVDEIDEPDLAGGAVDGMVVLSGGDEAAVVGAFRTIKSVASREGSGLDETPIRVAIVGHDSAGAREAFERLSRSAMHSLSREIGFAGSVERLASEPSASLYHGEWAGSIAELLEAVASGRPLAKPEPASERERLAESPTPDVSPAERVSGEEWRKSVEHPAATVATPERRADPETPAERPIQGDSRDFSPRERADRERMPASDSDGFAALIGGLEASAIRSPDAPAIEFAVDRDGRLQLMCPMELAGMVDGVLGWAVRHEALLRMADPQIRTIDPASAAHLICTDAASARAMLDGRHRVHLLVEVEVGGRVVRVTRALN